MSFHTAWDDGGSPLYNTPEGSGFPSRDEQECRGMPRDTLYVSSRPNAKPGSGSEWIVSYSANKGPEVSHVSGPISIEPDSYDTDPEFDVLDLYDVSDPYNTGRLIASRMLPGSGDKCVRIFLSLMDGPRIMNSVAALLLATNILQLTAFFIKKAPDSPELMLVICSRLSRETSTPTSIEFPKSADLSRFVADVFARVYGGSSVALDIGDETYLLAKCMGIVCYEALQDGTVPILQTDLQPSTSTVGGVRVVISQADSAVRARITRVIKTPPDETKSLKYVNRLNTYAGAVVEIDTARADLVQLANATIRSFMAGMCVVAFLSQEPFAPSLIEIAVIAAKYFKVVLSMTADTFQLTRKSATVDPVVPPPPAATPIEIPESDTVTTAAVAILQLLAKGGTKLCVCIPKSVPLLCGIFGVLRRTNANIQYELRTTSARVLVDLVLTEPLGDVAELIAELTEPAGDVSPSNYKPVDASIRQGTDAETAAFKAKLAALAASDGSKRVSVLLVGPWNIGLGIRLLTEGSGDAEFEFIAERAVRDSQGVNLKCAARLFVARDLMLRARFDELRESSAIVQVAEADSRITIANRLFTCLNEAPNENPYVLIRAEGDYCAFIAAMSVVVANGWSRSIHQRVECRVLADDKDTVFFTTRLIVNV